MPADLPDDTPADPPAPTSGQALFDGAVLAILQEAGEAVLILCDGLEDEELLGSRLTRREVQRQLDLMSRSLDGLGAAARSRLPELDWDGWAAVARELAEAGPRSSEALIYAVKSLAPATLMWLRVYRQNEPELFSLRA